MKRRGLSERRLAAVSLVDELHARCELLWLVAQLLPPTPTGDEGKPPVGQGSMCVYPLHPRPAARPRRSRGRKGNDGRERWRTAVGASAAEKKERWRGEGGQWREENWGRGERRSTSSCGSWRRGGEENRRPWKGSEARGGVAAGAPNPGERRRPTIPSPTLPLSGKQEASGSLLILCRTSSMTNSTGLARLPRSSPSFRLQRAALRRGDRPAAADRKSVCRERVFAVV